MDFSARLLFNKLLAGSEESSSSASLPLTSIPRCHRATGSAKPTYWQRQKGPKRKAKTFPINSQSIGSER